METKEIELDGKKVKIVVKLNGEYPEDIDIKDNKLGLAHDSTWLTNKNAINLGDGLIYDKETRTLKARGGGAVSQPDQGRLRLQGQIRTYRKK